MRIKKSKQEQFGMILDFLFFIFDKVYIIKKAKKILVYTQLNFLFPLFRIHTLKGWSFSRPMTSFEHFFKGSEFLRGLNFFLFLSFKSQKTTLLGLYFFVRDERNTAKRI